MTPMRSIVSTVVLSSALLLICSAGCQEVPKYGMEVPYILPGSKPQVWAVAPAINLSGQREVDPLLESDLLYHKLQEVRGLVVIPVDRVIQVYSAMRIEQVQSPMQAAIICEALGCDALVVPTVTAYDPYDPPKWGGALQMFRSGKSGGPVNLDVRDLARSAAMDPNMVPPPPSDSGFVQSV